MTGADQLPTALNGIELTAGSKIMPEQAQEFTDTLDKRLRIIHIGSPDYWTTEDKEYVQAVSNAGRNAVIAMLEQNPVDLRPISGDIGNILKLAANSGKVIERQFEDEAMYTAINRELADTKKRPKNARQAARSLHAIGYLLDVMPMDNVHGYNRIEIAQSLLALLAKITVQGGGINVTPYVEDQLRIIAQKYELSEKSEGK